MTKILVAKESFTSNGRVVRAGETFRAGHPAVEATPTSFEEWKVDNDWDAEEATKRPGKKRSAKKDNE